MYYEFGKLMKNAKLCIYMKQVKGKLPEEMIVEIIRYLI